MLSADDASDSDLDSLFDEVDSRHAAFDTCRYVAIEPQTDLPPARRRAPAIPGLYFDPRIILPDEFAEELMQNCLTTYFHSGNVDQVMLFERVIPSRMAGTDCSAIVSPKSCLPLFLSDLLAALSRCLIPLLPTGTHELLFPPPSTPPRARQVILNYYRPGDGITPHVDLLDRFGDGIMGVSLGSGCVMQFRKVGAAAGGNAEGKNDWDIFLPHGSVYVMSEEARYEWTHGIEGREGDWVQDGPDVEDGLWIMRSIRVSITFRWLLPGADIVGGPQSESVS